MAQVDKWSFQMYEFYWVCTCNMCVIYIYIYIYNIPSVLIEKTYFPGLNFPQASCKLRTRCVSMFEATGNWKQKTLLLASCPHRFWPQLRELFIILLSFVWHKGAASSSISDFKLLNFLFARVAFLGHVALFNGGQLDMLRTPKADLVSKYFCLLAVPKLLIYNRSGVDTPLII